MKALIALSVVCACFSTPALAVVSSENRSSQTVELLLGSYGYAVGLLFSDDHAIELGYSGLRLDQAEDAELTRWSQALFIHSRNFHGNSFNTSWGLTWEDSGFGEQPLHQSERSLLFVDAALGNQWSWRHFTFGVDWVGVSVPVFERVRVTDEGLATDQGRRTRLGTREWRGVDWHALTLFAGVVF
jgi:hypothetical protein